MHSKQLTPEEYRTKLLARTDRVQLPLVKIGESCAGCPSMIARVEAANALRESFQDVNVTEFRGHVVVIPVQLSEAQQTALVDLLTDHQTIQEDQRTVCYQNSEGIFRDGAQVGMYCPARGKELYYEEQPGQE